MSTLASIMGGIVSALALFFVYRNWKLKKNTEKRDLEVYEKSKPLIEALEKGEEPDLSLVKELAEDAACRTFLYVVLDQHQKLDLFPEKYKNYPACAEASLVYWLLHPNELGARPEKIKFVKKVEIPYEVKEKEELFSFYVFKWKEFKQDEEYIVGLAGPYLDSTRIYDFVPGSYSTFEVFDARSPEEHAKWVHEMLKKKKYY